MKITIYAIGKKDDRCTQELLDSFIKNSKKFATIKVVDLKVASMQNEKEARRSYTKVLEPYLLQNGRNIALDPAGKLLDSFAFAKILENYPHIAFFIGGAFGFEEAFLKSCDDVISLSPLTMSHKIAKLVLAEQVFRGLSILHKHPYHK